LRWAGNKEKLHGAAMTFWCNEQIVVAIDGPEGPREVLVPAPLARIGSHTQSDVVLAGDGVAKRALYLHATAEGLYSLDLDLTEGNLDERGRWLRPDDVLAVGPYRISARTCRGLWAPTGADNLVTRGSLLPPLPVLNIFCGRLLKDKRRFRSRLSLLGRRPQCSLQLRGAQVSSFHCALYWEQRRLWCIDLLSSNGTQLNGAPLNCDEVCLSDRLGVGEFELEYNRWSPRRSMQPGWEPTGSADAIEDDSPSSALMADVEAISGESPESGSSVITGSLPEASLQSQFAEEVARLASERLDMQRQWAETSQQLALRIEELHTESVKLSQERAALEAARAEWQAERESHAKELASRSSQLARLEAEMTAATRALAQRLANVESVAGAVSNSRPGTEGYLAPALLATGPTAAQPAINSAPVSVPEIACDSWASPELHEAQPFEEPFSVAEAAADGQAPAHAAIGRRGKAARNEMTTFVSDRLREMESSKRHKSFVLWATVGAATLTISAALWGVWLLLN
jgi:hypothetical protein